MSQPIKPLGLGFGLLGTSNVAPISDAQAEAMFAAAWAMGLRRFDTAPLYGGGLSEERLGRLLRGVPRGDYLLSSKVGRYRDYAARISNPKANPGDWRDYSRDATLRRRFGPFGRCRASRMTGAGYQRGRCPRTFGRLAMLNNIGLPGLLLIAVVVLVLFGRGKISSLMGEVGKGITAFKKGVSDSQNELEDDKADDKVDGAQDVTPTAEKEKV